MILDEIKRAAYIEERIEHESTKVDNENDMEFEKWLEKIKIPNEYINFYCSSYDKNENSFKKVVFTKNYECGNKDIMREFNDFLTFLNDNMSEIKILMKESLEAKEDHPFKFFAIPFQIYYVKKYESKFKKTEYMNFNVLERVIKEGIQGIVLDQMTKILLCEFEYYKKTHNSEDKYLEFCKDFLSKEVIEKIFEKYPVGFRTVLEMSNLLIQYLKEIEDNVIRDYEELTKIFDIYGKVQKIEMNLGDTHRGKKSVAILVFEKNKIVYKPRNLSVDEKFKEFIDYISCTIKCKLLLPKVKNKEMYGWQEYVESSNCNSEQEVKNFYYRIGIYTAIFYVLKATDLHMDNIICKGEYPVFIDLESLFQGYRGKRAKQNTNYEGYVKEIRSSVLSTCLFPGVVNYCNSKYDISGITGKGGQILAKRALVLDKAFSSDMKMIKKDYVVPEKKNIPVYKEKLVEPRKYAKQILDGFKIAYEFLEENQKDVISYLKNFFECPIRVILRDTAKYSLLLRASTEEKYMRDAKYRNQLFDRLWNMVGEEESFIKIVKSEEEDLCKGDVPYFYTFLLSTNLYDSKDRKIVDFFKETIYESVNKKIKSLCSKDKKLQMELIEQSMAIPQKRWELREIKKDYRKISNSKLLDKKEVEKEIEKIYDRIRSMSYDKYSPLDIVYPNLKILPTSQWAFVPMDNTLYEGELGVSLFITGLYLIEPKEEYKDLIKRIVKFSELYEKKYKYNVNISAFYGEASIAYCYYYIYLAMENEKLRELALKHLKACVEKIEDDNKFDLIAGCAGTLIIALRIYEKEKDQSLLELAILCGEHLVENVVHINKIFGWFTAAGNNMVLAGMSHGNAGIAWSLLELYKITKNTKYYDCAKMAIEYEDSLYNLEDNNWADLRNRENRIAKGFPEPVNWCHGAPGIGISRIFYSEIMGKETYMQDINNAIIKTLESGFGGSDCLCHGSMGNMELLLLAYQKFGDEQIYKKISSILSDLIEGVREGKWLCGIPQKTDVVGFMTGLSGIGYELLRCLNPEKIPCVFAFEFPNNNKLQDRSRVE